MPELIASRTAFCCSGSSIPSLEPEYSGVSTGPGLTALNRMPCDLSRSAFHDRIREATAALVAA